MKLYIATPVNARKEETFEEKYYAAQKRITELKENLSEDERFKGWEMTSGPDVCPLGMNETEALRRCVQTVLSCEAIYMDSGWQRSEGCRTEFNTAGRYKIPIYTYNGNNIKFE